MSEKSREINEKFNEPRDLKEVFRNISPELHGYLRNAQQFSRAKKHFYVGVEHFLAAFVSEPKSLLRKVMKNPKANWKKKANDLLDKAYNPAKKQKLWDVDMLATPRIQRLWDEAVQLTQFKDPTDVKEAHFLLVLLEDEDNFACKWLQNEDYNLAALIAEIRGEARDAGLREVKREPEEKVEVERAPAKPTPSAGPSIRVEDKGGKSLPQLEKPFSIDDIFKRNDAVQAAKSKPEAADIEGPSVLPQLFSPAVQEEVVFIGQQRVSVQSLRQRKLGDKIIDLIKDISAKSGCFPETLMIGEKRVSFDELIDMSLDEDAFLEVLEIAMEHFSEPPVDSKPGVIERAEPPARGKIPIPEITPDPMKPAPGREDLPIPQEPVEYSTQRFEHFKMGKDQKKYKTQELASAFAEDDLRRMSNMKEEETHDDEGTSLFNDQGYSTKELPKELIAKAKEELMRASRKAHQEEPVPPLTGPPAWKADPFGIGVNETELSEGSQQPLMEPPQRMHTQPESISGQEDSWNIDPLRIGAIGAELPDPTSFKPEDLPSPREAMMDSVPPQVEPISWNIDPFGIGATDEKSPDIVFFKEEIATISTEPRPEPVAAISSITDGESGYEVMHPEDQVLQESQHVIPEHPFGLPQELVKTAAEPAPEVPYVSPEAPSGEVPVAPFLMTPTEDNMVAPFSQEAQDALIQSGREFFAEQAPEIAPIDQMETDNHNGDTMEPIEEIKESRIPVAVTENARTSPEKVRQSELPREDYGPMPLFSQDARTQRVVADVAREQIMAREKVATIEAQSKSDSVLSMMGLKKKITLDDLFAIIPDEEKNPVLFDREINEKDPGPAPSPEASGAREITKPQLLSPISAESQARKSPSADAEISSFPVESEANEGAAGKRFSPDSQDFLTNMSRISVQDKYPGELWEPQEIDEVMRSILNATGHIVLLSKSLLKARALLKYMKERLSPATSGINNIYLLDVERLKTLSIEEVKERILYFRNQISFEKGDMFILLDLGTFVSHDALSGCFDALFDTLREGEIRCICSMTPEDYEGSLCRSAERQELFSSIRVKDVTVPLTGRFLKASSSKIEEEIQIKIDPALLDHAAEIALRFMEDPVYPESILDALRRAAEFKKEEFLDIGLDEIESIDKKDFLYIVSDSSA